MSNWRSRLSAMQIVPNFAIFNMFLITQDAKQQLKQLAVDTLCDEQLEVRLSASVSLTSLIHADFIPVDDDLIVNDCSLAYCV